MIGLRDLKLQVCFAEYSLFYRALLQKRPCVLGRFNERSLLCHFCGLSNQVCGFVDLLNPTL